MIRTHKLLIIEDNQELREILKGFFKMKPYDLVFASDGLDGLKLINKEKQEFDLVITDIVIPHVSGIGIISVLKTKCPDIPIIAITGFGEQPLSLASEAKADRVLRKPFYLVELENLITDLISHKKADTAKPVL